MAREITEEEIQLMISKLDITREESIELIQFDNGEVENEEVDRLTESAKKVSKEMRQISRAPETEKPKMAGVTTQTRKKKEDPTKQQIIQTINKALAEIENIENLKVENIEKTIFFTIEESNYEIDLKKKRK